MDRMTLLESSLLLSSGFDTEEYFPVYVMLTHSGTALSNAIKSVTKNPYSHASISFDSSMDNMYSFGRKYANNPLIGVFVKESIRKGLYANVSKTATYSLYVTFVTRDEISAMKERLQYFIDNKEKFKYNFVGLIQHQLGIESHREYAYFCSQFVSEILRSGKDYFNRHSSLVKPYDFAKHKDFMFIKKGKIANYSQNDVDNKTKTLLNKFKNKKGDKVNAK